MLPLIRHLGPLSQGGDGEMLSRTFMAPKTNLERGQSSGGVGEAGHTHGPAFWIPSH